MFFGSNLSLKAMSNYGDEHELSLTLLREASIRGDRCYALFDEDHLDRAYTYMYQGYTLRPIVDCGSTPSECVRLYVRSLPRESRD
jgi:hypothetical protein